MKKIIILVAAAIVALQTSSLYAVEKNKSMQMGGGTGKVDMGMMKQNMQIMVKQMEEIHSTQNPKKREMLLHEHMKNMHKGMQMMRGMGGDMMMGMMSDKKGSAGMMDKGMANNMSNKERGQRHQMMEQRLDMMQMMMEQMMGRMSMHEGMMPNIK